MGLELKTSLTTLIAGLGEIADGDALGTGDFDDGSFKSKTLKRCRSETTFAMALTQSTISVLPSDRRRFSVTSMPLFWRLNGRQKTGNLKVLVAKSFRLGDRRNDRARFFDVLVRVSSTILPHLQHQ
jgi:hypothetical protein